MTTNPVDRLDRIETAIENLTSVVAGLASATVASNERMERDRQASNERMTKIESAIETWQEPLEILLEAATRHEAMISRLDAILERMVYREGRGSNDEQQ